MQDDDVRQSTLVVWHQERGTTDLRRGEEAENEEKMAKNWDKNAKIGGSWEWKMPK